MNFSCDECDIIFSSKHALTYHLNNDVCKKKEYPCKYCVKTFTTETSMYRHMRLSCKAKKEEDENENENKRLYDELIEDRDRHGQQIMDLMNEMNAMKASLNENQLVREPMTINNTNNVNTVNVTINNNINLSAYGKEDMSKITKAELLKVFKSGFNSTLKLIDIMHFNPKYPEFHNIYISSMKNQYAMIYDGHDWTLVMKDYLIDKLYDDKREYIEENLDEFINSLSDSQLSALYRWLNAADGHSYIKNIKNDIKLLLYNKRKLPMNNKINNQQEAEIMNILNALENLEPVESEENTESKVIKKPKLKFQLNKN